MFILTEIINTSWRLLSTSYKRIQKLKCTFVDMYVAGQVNALVGEELGMFIDSLKDKALQRIEWRMQDTATPLLLFFQNEPMTMNEETDALILFLARIDVK